MNWTPSLALAGLFGALCCLPLAASEAAPQVAAEAEPSVALGASAGDPFPDDWTTIVVRYHPQAIFLTYELVEPICMNEVRLVTGDGASVGAKLELLQMSSNALQPKGVFVGRVRVAWSAEPPPEQEARDRLLASGLDQLREALSRRLYGPEYDALSRQIKALDAMAVDRAKQLEVVSRELAESERRSELSAMIREHDAKVQALELERGVGRQGLTMGLAKAKRTEQLIEKVEQLLLYLDKDLARQEKLFESGMVSEGEIGRVRLRRTEALQELEATKSRVAASQADVSLLAAQVESVESQSEKLRARLAQFHAERGALPPGPPSVLAQTERRMALDLDRDVRRDQVRELRTELERVRIQLGTLTNVVVEAW